MEIRKRERGKVGKGIETRQGEKNRGKAEENEEEHEERVEEGENEEA